MSERDGLKAAELVRAVTSWATTRLDIRCVALVGSHARGSARPDSDVDFVIVCETPAQYVQEVTWVGRFGIAHSVSVEDWGRLQAVRAFYSDGLEADYGFTSLEWVALPLDVGTVEVLEDGAIVLVDRDDDLTRAVERACER